MMIDLQTIISRNNTNFLFNELGTEIVIMNTKTGDYLGLNEVSSEIWKLLDKPTRPEDIINRLLQDFSVSEDECKEQTMAFLNKMEGHGMLIHE
ncbi:MAG: PqqD family protein [Mucilaginibacter sp.]